MESSSASWRGEKKCVTEVEVVVAVVAEVVVGVEIKAWVRFHRILFFIFHSVFFFFFFVLVLMVGK